jgi:TrmH family RNA methyltransferase
MPEVITSTSNPLLKQIRALRQKKGRQESGLFLVEGIHHVGEVVEAGWEIEILIHAPELLNSDFGLHLVKKLSDSGMRIVTLTPKLFISIAEKENPQGLMAIVRQRKWNLKQIQITNFRLGAAVISPQDPGNVGTILRTLDAVGGEALFLLEPQAGVGGSVEIYHPSVIRASMGTIFWKPVVETSVEEFVNWTRKHTVRLVGSSAHASVDYHELPVIDSASILLLGSEQKGLSPEQLACCDTVVSLPMHGRTSSLNLAVAAGILLYALTEKR